MEIACSDWLLSNTFPCVIQEPLLSGPGVEQTGITASPCLPFSC